VPVKRPGQPLDFSFTSLATPIVHDRIAVLLAELAPTDVQFLPVELGSQPEQYRLPLIVSEVIKESLERLGTTGTKFKEV